MTFPVLAKVSVKGDDIDPLYKFLTTSSAKPGDIGWNFAKFLINRKGEVVDRFDPKAQPDDATVTLPRMVPVAACARSTVGAASSSTTAQQARRTK